MPEKTTVKISRETWKRLTMLKDEPGETYDEVIAELLDEAEGPDEGNSKSTSSQAPERGVAD